MILLVVAVVILATYAVVESAGSFRDGLRPHGSTLAVVSVCLVSRWGFVWHLNVSDQTYGPIDWPHLVRAYQHLIQVPQLCLREMVAVDEWGVLWPTAVVCGSLLLFSGSRKERFLTAGMITCVAAYTAVFFFTNWDMELHIKQAYGRMLVHLAPAAVIVVCCGYRQIRGGDC